jgi:hypothetical protein
MRLVRKTSSRLVLAAAALALAAPAIAQTAACARPEERRAFEVRALQTQLQVAALQCRDEPGYARLEDEYRQFVRRFQGEFQAGARDFLGYYRRTAGASHTRVLDASITNLALEQSQEAVRHGSFYCPLAAPLFRGALQQGSLDELAQFAVDRNVINPFIPPVCPARATPAAARAGAAARPAGQRPAQPRPAQPQQRR